MEVVKGIILSTRWVIETHGDKIPTQHRKISNAYFETFLKCQNLSYPRTKEINYRWLDKMSTLMRTFQFLLLYVENSKQSPIKVVKTLQTYPVTQTLKT